VFAPLERRYLELASRLIETYDAHVGRRKGGLVEQCQQFENTGFDYRLVRALVTLLDRSAEFVARTRVDPRQARLAVFREANRYPLIDTNELRQKVIEQAAFRLGIASIELERSLWSDFEDELILDRFAPPSPTELVRQYNLGLTQTLLFRATSLEFVVGSNYQRIFSRLKYLGLMYSVERSGDDYLVLVDGPVALFKLTERYGTSIAKLLPLLLEADQWSLTAHIISGEPEAPKLLEMELTSDVAGKLFPVRRGETESERYDSSVEAAFAHSFNALKLGWVLKREPGLLTAGRSVLIPDFSFEKNGMKAYLEVVGFWTNEYLTKKLAKLQEVDVANLLVAVDRSLNCAQFTRVKGRVIFYDKKVPLKPIVDYLKRLEENAIMQQGKTIDHSRLSLAGDVVDVAPLAEEQHVSVAALVRWLQANLPAGYRLIGVQLVSEQKLAAIADKLRLLSRDTLPAALSAIEEEGLASAEKTLEALGYVVEWRGLDPERAVIRRQSLA
jgi:predicted nuclease of restriction endonuclease-like RecB superfamily